MKSIDQTLGSFRDKWQQNRTLAFSETLNEGSTIYAWILSRNGFSCAEDMRKWLFNRRKILDAGCGNGRVTALLRKYAHQAAEIFAIDLTSAEVARDNLAGLEKITVIEKDLLENLSELGKFDLIYCQEVLHHTPNPQGAFENLCRCLSEDGEIAIYVYKLKAPIREYADDYVRKMVSNLTYDEALQTMNAVTELGRALSELDIKVNVPEVAVLGIEAGEYELQRFIYHFFLKCFWNPSLSFEENAAINYDWYHPQLCTRHTLSEVEDWFTGAGIEIIHRCVDHYGITVRGIKRG